MFRMILMMLFLLINVARAWVCKDGDSKCGSVSATINNVKQCCPDGCGISSNFYNGGLINVCTGCGSDNGCTPAGRVFRESKWWCILLGRLPVQVRLLLSEHMHRQFKIR